MKTPALLVTGSLLFLILASCSSLKRFRTVDYGGEDNNLVDVELFHAGIVEDPAEVREKNLWSLSANAQTRLIQILDERYPDNEEFMSHLGGNLEISETPPPELTRKDLRMIFSVRTNRDFSLLNKPQGRFSPADRIEYLKLSLEIPEQYNLRFAEWNRYMTEYGEMEIADVSFSRTLDLSAEGSPAGVDLGSEFHVGRTERQVLNKRYLKLSGSISDHRVVMEAEGTREVDLTGNVTADVSLVFQGFPEKVMIPVFMAGEDGTRELSSLNILDVLVPAMPDAPDTLFADLRFEYIYRHVASGWKTYAEWDDGVEYYQGSMIKRVPLFSRYEYLPRFFCIGTDQGGKESLKLYLSPQKEYLLQFRDYRDAGLFLEWLSEPGRSQTDPVFVGDYRLMYCGSPVTPGEVVEAQMKVLPVY
jgi:hypothetical protein